MARAISSFPVPVSPKMRVVASLGATVLACASTRLRGATLSYDLLEVELRADLIFQIKLLFGKLIGEVCNLAIGSGIIEGDRDLRGHLLQNVKILRFERVLLPARKVQGTHLAFAGY